MADLPNIRVPELPRFDDSNWTWDEDGSHYEGDRVHPGGVWLARRRDPYAPSPGTGRNLAEDFEFNAATRFPLAVEAFYTFNLAIGEYARKKLGTKRNLQAIVRTLDNEIAVVRRSFERANNHPFRLHFTDEVLRKDDYLYELECTAAKLFFQLDQLRNCAKQDSRAYTIEQLDVIYTTFAQLIQQLIRNIEGNSYATIER